MNYYNKIVLFICFCFSIFFYQKFACFIITTDIWVKLRKRGIMDSSLRQDVKGPQTIAFNLPNDERVVKDRGTSMVILKNVSEAKYILSPIFSLIFPHDV